MSFGEPKCPNCGFSPGSIITESEGLEEDLGPDYGLFKDEPKVNMGMCSDESCGHPDCVTCYPRKDQEDDGFVLPGRFDPFETLDAIEGYVCDIYKTYEDQEVVCNAIAGKLETVRAYITGMEK